jgi:hypothetical protein
MEAMMNEVQENIKEQDSNEEGFVVELDDKQSSDPVEPVKVQNENEEQTIVRTQDDDEHEEYGAKVRKRIDKEVAKRKAAEEDSNNAIQYAKQIEEENKRIKQQLDTYTKGYETEFDTRVTSQEAQVKQILKDAIDANDPEKIAEATAALTQVNIQKERVKVLKQNREQEQATQKNERQSSQTTQEVKQSSIENNPKIKAWISRNPWYGKDDEVEKNYALMLVDRKVTNMGYEATEDRYYEEIDKQLAQMFPQEFQGNSNNVQTVAPVNGRPTAKTGRKTRVVLSESEKRTADRLGVPYEKYAQQKLKLQKGA